VGQAGQKQKRQSQIDAGVGRDSKAENEGTGTERFTGWIKKNGGIQECHPGRNVRARIQALSRKKREMRKNAEHSIKDPKVLGGDKNQLYA